MGQNQYLRQNFSIGKQMLAKSGNVQEMENVLGIGTGEIASSFFPLKFFWCIFIVGLLVLLVYMMVFVFFNSL